MMKNGGFATWSFQLCGKSDTSHPILVPSDIEVIKTGSCPTTADLKLAHSMLHDSEMIRNVRRNGKEEEGCSC